MSRRKRPGTARRGPERSATAPVAREVAGVEPGEPAAERFEAWAWCAFAVLLAFLVWLVYLGARPGGRGPLLAYTLGPLVLTLAALGVLVFAALWSATHRPLFQRRRLLPFLSLVAVLGAPQFPFPYPTSHAGRPSRVDFRLPVEGEWTVVWGGLESEHNRLAAFLPDRRFGLDLVVTRDGRSHEGDGRDPRAYFAFDQPVLAPADATVARVRDGEEDGAIWSPSAREPFGNHVVLEVAPGEYVFLAHLRAGSIRVAPGEAVRAGAEIARVGSSGWSKLTPEPHLALHLQDSPEARAGEAIPWSVVDYEEDAVAVERGLPRGGIARDGRFLGARVRARAAPVR